MIIEIVNFFRPPLKPRGNSKTKERGIILEMEMNFTLLEFVLYLESHSLFAMPKLLNNLKVGFKYYYCNIQNKNSETEEIRS